MDDILSPFTSRNTFTKGANTFKHIVTPFQKLMFNMVEYAVFPLAVFDHLHSSHSMLVNIALKLSFFSTKLCNVWKTEANLVTPGLIIFFFYVGSHQPVL